jgi:hypothetical protein
VLDLVHPRAQQAAVVDDHVRRRDGQREQDGQRVAPLAGDPHEPRDVGRV